MYPSTNNNGDYTFTHSTIQPITFSSLYDNRNNDINLSQPLQERYCPPSSSPFHLLNSPHGITFGNRTILSRASSDDHTNTVVHEQISTPDIWASVQCALGNCSDNYGRVVNGDAGKCSTRRSTSKKDRHSKIYTAQGPRDRRMRLSLDVAKKFFKLQDMLGFDKASETVEWLLMKSKSGIQELLPQHLIRRSSECDQVLSGNIDDQNTVKSSSSSDHKEKKRSGREVRKSAYLLRPLAKETREKARARARERTMVKSNRLARLDPDVNLLDSCTFNQLKQGTIDDNFSSMSTDNWSSSLFNYQHSRVPRHEHQFSDFQTLGNLWEGNK